MVQAIGIIATVVAELRAGLPVNPDDALAGLRDLRRSGGQPAGIEEPEEGERFARVRSAAGAQAVAGLTRVVETARRAGPRRPYHGHQLAERGARAEARVQPAHRRGRAPGRGGRRTAGRDQPAGRPGCRYRRPGRSHRAAAVAWPAPDRPASAQQRPGRPTPRTPRYAIEDAVFSYAASARQLVGASRRPAHPYLARPVILANLTGDLELARAEGAGQHQLLAAFSYQGCEGRRRRPGGPRRASRRNRRRPGGSSTG